MKLANGAQDLDRDFSLRDVRTLWVFGIALMACLPAMAHADRTADIAARLKDFGANPKNAMNKLPPKFDPRTGAPVAGRTAFTPEQIASGEFVTLKDAERQNRCTTVGGARVCLSQVLPGRAPYLENDLAENLVDNAQTMLRTLEAMESQNLKTAQLTETPWSDTYWPIYEGQIANRYADPNFPNASNWHDNWNYAKEHGFLDIFRLADAGAIDNLSPAEKYDLLVGDDAGLLTQSNWDEGEHYYRESHKVESWMGICHGWSPASYMVARPRHSIELVAADGKTKLTFYPSDIKGLASLLWAKTTGESRLVGGRCNDKHPRTDANGRILSQDCFDTNPGTWHMAVVNQIGVSKRSFVIDATWDYEVWNQPVYSYSYTYFNPQTRKPVETLNEARVEMKDFTEDKFKKYRSTDAVSAVGIAMDLTYMQETNPSHEPTDSPENDSPYTVRYMYDVELNAKGEIIGGEWYENAHPDFMWTPAPDERVVTVGDRFATDEWKGHGAVPESWRKAAASTSKSSSSPLSKVVDVLSGLAHE